MATPRILDGILHFEQSQVPHIAPSQRRGDVSCARWSIPRKEPPYFGACATEWASPTSAWK